MCCSIASVVICGYVQSCAHLSDDTPKGLVYNKFAN